jgi:hypothetical protein
LRLHRNQLVLDAANISSKANNRHRVSADSDIAWFARLELDLRGLRMRAEPIPAALPRTRSLLRFPPVLKKASEFHRPGFEVLVQPRRTCAQQLQHPVKMFHRDHEKVHVAPKMAEGRSISGVTRTTPTSIRLRLDCTYG